MPKETFVFEEWVSTSGTQDIYFYGKSITDGAGNVYQVGATINSDGNYDAIISKTDRNGQELWLETFNPSSTGDDTFIDVILNGSGEVIATGASRNASETSSDAFTVQLDVTDGSTDWDETYSYSGSIFNLGSALAIDNSDNVYVTGLSYNATDLSDVLILKYNTSGTLQWANTEDINGMEDGAVKLVYSSGKLTASGATQIDPDKYRYLVTEFSASTGALLNSTQGASNVTSIDQVQDLVIDDQGNIYITGYAGATGEGYNMYTMKLDDDLNVLWDDSYNYGGSNHDRAYGIALDGLGNVIVTGCSDLGSGNTQFTTIKYNSTGTLQWTATEDVSAGGDTARAVVVDSNNNIYISGSFDNGSNQDVRTIKYSDGGSKKWEIDYNGIANGDEYILDMTRDGTDVLVTFQTETDGAYKYATVKYSEKDVVLPPDGEDIPSSTYFVKNNGNLKNTSGNAANDVIFVDKGSSISAYIHDDKLSYVITKADMVGVDTVHRVDMIINKLNPDQRFYPFNKKKYYENYYIGNGANGKRERVETFNTLVSFDAYDDVDLMLSHNNRGLKMYFICKPGFSNSDIQWEYSGASGVSVGTSDELNVSTSLGSLIIEEGEAYEVNSSGVRIDKTWAPEFQVSGNQVDFNLGSYNTANTLVLELDYGLAASGGVAQIGNMLWNSYYGSNTVSRFKDVTSDNFGDFYILGETAAGNFPTNTGQETTSDYSDGFDAIVVKLNDDVEPIWLSYFGGSENQDGGDGNEIPKAIDVRLNTGDIVLNQIYITGYTNSDDMLIESNGGAFDTDNQNNCTNGTCFDGFIAQLSEDGSLEWSTYYGSDGDETLRDIEIDWLGNIYAVGSKNANTNLVTRSGADNYSSGDGLLLMYNANKQLQWANAWDGDIILGICSDGNNNIFTTGATESSSMPALNWDQTYTASSSGFGNLDIFVNSFNSSGELQHSFYWGGNCAEGGTDIEVDDKGNCYVVGNSGMALVNCGNTMPLVNGVVPISGADNIILKYSYLDPQIEVVHSTFFGGTGGDGIFNLTSLDNPARLVPYEEFRAKVDTDINGNVYLCSYTRSSYVGASTGIPLPGTQPAGFYAKEDLTSNVGDNFISAFNSSMDLIWTTYHGSDKYDFPGGITITQDNNRLVLVSTGNQGATASDLDSFDPTDYDQGNLADYFQNYPVEQDVNAATAAIFDISDINTPLSTTNKIVSQESIKIYPNPSSSAFQIESRSAFKDLYVYDLTGRLLLEKNFGLGTNYGVLELNKFSSGTYLLKVDNHSTLIIKK